MIEIRLLGTLAAFTLLTTGACGGGGSDPLPIDQFGARAGEVVCKKLFECCTAAELVTELENFGTPAPTTEEECVAAYQSFFTTFLAAQQAAINAGRIEYQASVAGSCMDKAEAASCAQFAGDFLEDDEECEAIFVGKVAVDGACDSDNECAGGGSTSCEPSELSPSDVCVQLPGSGEGCTGSCAEGFYCGIAAGGGTCQAVKANGAACDGDVECDSDNCDTSGGAGGTCAAPLSGPATCDGV